MITRSRFLRLVRVGSLGLAATVLLGASPRPIIPWDDLTEIDWLYSLATRFSLVDTHRAYGLCVVPVMFDRIMDLPDDVRARYSGRS